MLLILPALFFVFILRKYVLTRYDHLVPNILHFSIPAFLSFIYVLIFIPFIIHFAKKFKIISIPAARNDFDKVPTPLLGGIAIYLSFLMGILAYDPDSMATRSILVAASIIFFVGTIDDITPLSSIIRLIAQIIASLIVMSGGLMVTFMPNNFFGVLSGGLITIIWILGIINATNFFDGADGLACGMIGLSSIFFFLITLHLEQYHVAIISVILAGCCFGFLFFNFKPAKIYLGDGGSTLLGFLIACIALYGGWSSKGPIIALGIPILILGVFIFDMIYITIARILRGNVKNFKQWLDYTGKDHFHHRLISLGFKESQAVLFIYIVCVVLGLNALVIENAKMSYPVVLQIINSSLFLILIIMLMLVGRQTSIKNI